MMAADRAGGYGEDRPGHMLSADEVARGMDALGSQVERDALLSLCAGEPLLELRGLHAGYGAMEILHGIDLALGTGQSLCLIGPNGAGKSTVLNAIFGFAKIGGGQILVGGKDITALAPSERLKQAGIAYVLQDNSIFPEMSVEENLLMGGYLLPKPAQAREAAEKIFARYDRLAKRRRERAGVLSGGERRLLEISRALIMDPHILLIDEPSIGLEPRMIDMVFEILTDLQKTYGKTVLMVEQNARKGLQFADLGYVMVAGRVALAARGSEILDNPSVGRLFLGA